MTDPKQSLTSFADALATVLAEARTLGPEAVPLDAACGRMLAQDIVAPFDLPHFDNTSVDGYAVHATDVERANRERSAELALDMVIPAGEALRGRELKPGCAARVLTGSPLPAGTGAVVMQEEVELRDEQVRITAGISAGQCIRRQGEEYHTGDIVVSRGQRLSPPVCALAATMGLTQVTVARAPRVGLLLTGSELVAPGRPLREGQIYESNGSGLAAALRLAGIAALEIRTVNDALEPTLAALADLLDTNDVVITSGGVSVGTYDAVKDALRQLKVEQRIWRVAIKPGKPFFFGLREQAGHRTVVFGLPGNPLSALVTFSVFAFPYLRAVQGEHTGAVPIPARLATPTKNPAGRLEFAPVTLTPDEQGWRAQPLDKRASHMLGGFARAQALAIFPAERERLEAGESVTCQLLPWN